MNSNNKVSPVYSCEFFPPRTDTGMEKLLAAQKKLHANLDPAFFSVTFGAGGSTRDRTLETVKQLQLSDTSIAPHISCVGSTKEQLNDVLDAYVDMGVTRLVTLRGDIPEGDSHNSDFSHANELVSFIREKTGDQFHIEVAAYPEYHPESTSPDDDFKHFLNKVKAGANSAITQYFYNIDAYLNFMDRCNKANINIPVVPGIMPITNYTSLTRFSDNCGAEIPRWIRKQLSAYENDPDSLLAFGTDVVVDLSAALLESGSPGLHFYTLNQADATLRIWDQLNT